MALPKSTYVMGGVVLALFGLAVRDTLAKHAPPPPEAREDYAAGMARAEAEARDAKLEAERQSFENLLASSRTVFGPEVASLGTLFAGTALGRSRSATAAHTEASFRDFETITGSTITFGPFEADPIGSVTLQLYSSLDSTDRDRACLWLDRLLESTWGKGTPREHDAIWVNQFTQQRAVFTTGNEGCTLAYERYLDADTWLAAILPALGRSEEAAKAFFGGRSDGPLVLAEIAGLGTGSGLTTVRADVERKKIRGITASTTVHESTRTQLVDALIAAYGVPSRREVADDLTTHLVRWNKPQMKIVLILLENGVVQLSVQKT